MHYTLVYAILYLTSYAQCNPRDCLTKIFEAADDSINRSLDAIDKCNEEGDQLPLKRRSAYYRALAIKINRVR